MIDRFRKLWKSLAAAALIVELAGPGFVPAQAVSPPQQSAPVQSTPFQSTPQAPNGSQARPVASSPLAEAPSETIAPMEMTVARGGDSLSPDEKILMVLNRFTYGPRPADLERVREEGLSHWFGEQLNPWKLDDSALERRLEDYPAMRLPVAKLMEMYPDGGTVRDVMGGRNTIPGGEGERALYLSQMDRYKEKKAAKNEPDRRADNPPPLPEEPEAYLAMEPKKRFEELTKLTPAMMNELRKQLPESERARLTEGLSAHQIEILAAFSGPANMIGNEAVQTKLLRDIFSERQLNEIMVDFWLNHFNVYLRKSQQAPYFITSFERDTIRPRALGSFENLLVATALSPAMLNYLDNEESVGPHSDSVIYSGPLYTRRPNAGKKVTGLNENYARELMELHTIGVNGGYTQQDVTNVAKVFTGWTLSKGMDGLNVHPTWDMSKHEPGDKMVLGVKIKMDGMKEGFEVLHLLASSPQCAHFISYKLAVRFVSDNPPPALVDAMARTFLETHGQIRPVLATMINSPLFFTRANYQAKVKTPQEYVVSAVRASGASVDSAGTLAATISDLGMPVYGMATPQGYAMTAEAWNNTAALIARLNFALALSSNRVAGLHVDWGTTLGVTAAAEKPESDGGLAGLSPQEKDLRLEEYLLHTHVSDRTRKTILAQIEVPVEQQQATLRQIAARNNGRDPLSTLRRPLLSQDSGAQDPQTILAAGLILGSPEFQRR